MNIFIHFSILYIIVMKLYLATAEMSPYIVDGTEADIRDYPYSVFIIIKCSSVDTSVEDGTSICGGSILNENLILTAAHCTFGCGSKSILGAMVSAARIDKGGMILVHNYFIHEYYNPQEVANDICMLKSKFNFNFNNKVQRIIIADKVAKNSEVVVAGWGLTDESDSDSVANVLRKAKGKVLAKNLCESKLNALLPNHVICTAPVHGYAASGDSGSPLVEKTKQQIGLVSFKLKDRHAEIVVYSDVTQFKPWIKKTARLLACAK